jgi:Calx-beta domain
MQGKVRRGMRVAFAVAVATAFVLSSAVGSGARSTDVTTTVSIGTATSASVVEGQSASFPITLSAQATADFRVPWTTSEGNSGTFDVTSGDMTEPNLTVPTNSNSTPEPDRNLTVTLGTPIDIPDDASSDATTAAIGTASATVLIVDDDWQIGSISAAPASATVSESGGQTIDFSASLNGSAPGPGNHAITVDYAVANGTAKNGQNFTVTNPAGVASGTLTFTPGTSTVDVQVTSKDDGIFGPNRTFTVTFSNPQGATFASGANEQATGTITENDAPPAMGFSDCTGETVNAGGVASFPILLASLGSGTPKTTVPASVDYTTVDDTTITGDYTPTSGTAVIPVGQREFDVKVPTIVNGPSGDRSFHVQLSNPQNVTLRENSASCTIQNGSGGGGGGGGGGTNQPSITISDPAPVTAPTSGSVPVSVPLSLTLASPLPSSPQPVSVQWQTQDGTAKAGTDYTANSGTITWPAGSNGPNPTPVTIAITPDPAATAPISFTVAFTSSDATFVGGGTATITIVPPGSTIPLISVADTSVEKHGGSVPVIVTMSPASTTGTVTVDYATADGTGANAAVAGTNYTARSGTLTLGKGATTTTITVPIIPNQLVEPNRSFTVNLTNATGGAAIAVGSATVTILNDVATQIKPPVLTPKKVPTQKQPVAQPTTQPKTPGKDHFVLVQVLTGTSHVDAKGRAPLTISCPSIVIRSCVGTAVFDIGVRQKVGKKFVVKTMHVAKAAFSLNFGKTGTLTATLTPAGLKLLLAAKRMKVKATISSHDASGAQGVTAWLVSLQAPPPVKTKPVTKKKK